MPGEFTCSALFNPALVLPALMDVWKRSFMVFHPCSCAVSARSFASFQRDSYVGKIQGNYYPVNYDSAASGDLACILAGPENIGLCHERFRFQPVMDWRLKQRLPACSGAQFIFIPGMGAWSMLSWP